MQSFGHGMMMCLYKMSEGNFMSLLDDVLASENNLRMMEVVVWMGKLIFCLKYYHLGWLLSVCPTSSQDHTSLWTQQSYLCILQHFRKTTSWLLNCWQLQINFITTSTLLKYLIPSLRVNLLSPALTAISAVASFASFARCYKLLAANFNVNIT